MSRPAGVARLGAALLALLALFGAALPFAFASRPPASRDYFAIWGLKARHLAGPDPASTLTSPALRRSHLDYPLLYPGLLLAIGAEGTAPAPSRANLAGAVASLLTAVACALSLRAWRVPAPLLFGAVALVAWRPVLTQEGYLCLAEPLLCLFLTAGALLGAWGLENGRHDAVGLSALSFTLAALTKNEGLPPALAFFAVAVISNAATTANAASGSADPDGRSSNAATPGPLTRLGRSLLPLLPSVLLLCGWQAVKWAHATGSEYLRADRLSQPATLPSAALESAGLVLRTMWASPEVGALLLGALALAAAPDAVGRRFRLVVASSAGVHLLALLAVYTLTPYDRAWHVGTSAIRLLSVWTPLALVSMARAWGREPK